MVLSGLFFYRMMMPFSDIKLSSGESTGEKLQASGRSYSIEPHIKRGKIKV
jgi:hypothetical protein